MNYIMFHKINEIHGEAGSNVAKQEIYELWQLCFGDSDRYTDFYFQWKVKDNRILTIYCGDQLCSTLHLNPYTLKVQNRSVNTNYIVGVATRPEYRRQGLMKMILEKALQQMYEEKMEFTYLMPAAEAIYLPYDFRVVYEQEPWNQNVLNTKTEEKPSSETGIQVLKVSDQDNILNQDRIADLVTFSNNILSKTYDIYVERTPFYYTRLIHEMHSSDGEVLLCYENDSLEGYISFMAEDAIYITEMIYANGKKDMVNRKAALYFKEHYNLPIYERKPSKQIPAIMTRIVNWQSFIEPVTSNEDMELVIKVQDPILKQNNGIYALNFTKKGCACRKTKQEPEIDASIADLTKLFFNRMDKKGLEDMITASDKQRVMDKVNNLCNYKSLFINDVV